MRERLQKFIAHAGIASRRRAEQLILNGQVKVNGVIISELGHKIDPMVDVIAVNDQVINLQKQKVYLMLHKPAGYVTTVFDPQGRPTVLDLVSNKERLFPVGRLDLDSEGLLLLTNDGTLANLLTHPRYGVTKTYEVWVQGRPTTDKIRTLTTGVQLEDGPARALRVSLVGGWSKGSRFEVVMVEGRKREVRRLFQVIGAPVKRLIRQKIGPLSLVQLPLGQTRPLTKDEIASLYQAAGQPLKNPLFQSKQRR
ncbi:MAG: pseudouridine synthase [bacterium]